MWNISLNIKNTLTHTYTCTHTCTHTHTRARTLVCVHHACTHTCTHSHTLIHMHTHTCAHMHVHVHACAHMRTPVHPHTRMHIYAHMHTAATYVLNREEEPQHDTHKSYFQKATHIWIYIISNYDTPGKHYIYLLIPLTAIWMMQHFSYLDIILR